MTATRLILATAALLSCGPVAPAMANDASGNVSPFPRRLVTRCSEGDLGSACHEIIDNGLILGPYATPRGTLDGARLKAASAAALRVVSTKGTSGAAAAFDDSTLESECARANTVDGNAMYFVGDADYFVYSEGEPIAIGQRRECKYSALVSADARALIVLIDAVSIRK